MLIETAATAKKVLESIFFNIYLFFVLCVFVLIETAAIAEKVMIKSKCFYFIFYVFCVFCVFLV